MLVVTDALSFIVKGVRMPAEPIWSPSRERINRARLVELDRSCDCEAIGPGGSTAAPDSTGIYARMHAWSLRDPASFWTTAWDFCGVVGERGERALVPGRSMREDRFFPDARLNVVDTLLARRGEDDAVIAADETGSRRALSWDALRSRVGACAAALRADGVGVGDHVVAWLPNGIEAIVVMLAAASIGAVFASSSPDFGAAGVLDRFGQLGPRVLVAGASYSYGGKRFDCRARLGEIVAGLDTLRRVVVVGGEAGAPDRAVTFDAWLARHTGAELVTEKLPFDHPWYVLFSSGTTGKPKCIVHRAGGVLLKHLAEHQLQCDVRAGDRALYFTTTGWMMWNWLASFLGSGASIVLFDGSPFHPSADVLFDLVDRENVTMLGLSAKFIDACAKADRSPRSTHSLASLRTICSTGSPLSPEGCAYVYEHVATDVHLASISGGTDLCGCFVGGDPTGPVWAGEIQRPVLGMAVGVWSDDGQPLGPGDGAGELVCTQSFPSMPLGFLDDPGDARYRSAYFDKFPGVWAHGDFASWTDHGGVIVHGRSDATLNPGGVRIGTAEIYRVVEQHPDIAESLVVGQHADGDVRVVLLVRLAPGAALDDDLRADLRARVRNGCSPRHVPAVIAAVDDLPRTRSGKLAELAVADLLNGRAVRNTGGLANPEVLGVIAAMPELARPA